MANEMRHSPTPWKIRMDDYEPHIEDTSDNNVATCWGYDELARVNADYIVECVNAHERLVAENARLNEVAVNLHRSRANIIADNDKLRDLVRRMLAVVERVKEGKVYALGTISDERIREMLEHRNVQRQKWGEELAELNSILEHARNVFGEEAGND